jgi:two-component system sensor histidine kinase AlgZ
MSSPDQTSGSFLPDFCGARTVFVVVLLAELLAIVLTLSHLPYQRERLVELAMYSLFIQWVALSCIAILCIFRQHLNALKDYQVGVISYLISLFTTFVVAELAWWVQNKWVSGDYFGHGHGPFVLRILGISAIVWALALRYFYVQFQLRQQIVAEAESRFQALQSRIKPHFLFNCMNTIASLIRRNPAAAEQVVEDLADLFRVSLQDRHGNTTLQEELDLCRRYLRIEQLRLGDRLDVDWRADDLPGHLPLPALILQPLLENAIYHGIERLPDGGRISLYGDAGAKRLQIHIENPVPDVTDRRGPEHRGNKLAQDNIDQRLTAFFEQAGLLRAGRENDHYHVTVTIPYGNENTDRRR